mgnify:CR=1 FL=1
MARLAFLAILALVVFVIGCLPKKGTVTAFPCSSCDTNVVVHLPDTNSVRYYLPTAFTPNGDGINDVFWIFQTGLDPDSCRMTIYDRNGKTVFSNTITHAWDGSDMGGAICAAGKYPVALHLNYVSGATRINMDICACVTILKYSGSCINTGGITYHFPDQIALDSGFVFPTMDQICP